MRGHYHDANACVYAEVTFPRSLDASSAGNHWRIDDRFMPLAKPCKALDLTGIVELGP